MVLKVVLLLNLILIPKYILLKENIIIKKILSLDLGITSIGYSILEEMDNDRYSLVDYGVSMFDKPVDKDGNSKKLLHSQSKSTTKLYDLRKQRKHLSTNIKRDLVNILLLECVDINSGKSTIAKSMELFVKEYKKCVVGFNPHAIFFPTIDLKYFQDEFI